MLTTFLITAAIVLALVILRAYSFAQDTARHLAKAERERLQDLNPDHPIGDLEEDAFIAFYEWLRRRRFWLYLGLFLIIASTETLVVMAALAALHEIVNPGPWMWGFIAIFVLTAGWALSAWVTLYYYRIRTDAALLGSVKRWPGPGEAEAAAED